MDLTSLIAYWKLDGNVNDFTNTLTTTNVGITFSGGRYAQCGNFNGSSNYAQVTYNSAQDLANNPTTATAWIKTSTSFSSSAYIYGNIVFSSSSFSSHSMYVNLNNKIVVFIRDASNNAASVTSSNTINNGLWNHIAFTDDGTTLKLYINGVLDGSVSSSAVGNINTLATIQIGRYVRSNDTGSAFFNGQIQKITLWKRALTASEILEMYRGVTHPFFNNNNFFNVM